MKIFISHSGERGSALANQVKAFVRGMLQSADPWVSTGIEKGSRWEPELAGQLVASGIGIVCLTPESLDSRWILFEAGALARHLDGKVCTLLLGVTSEQVLSPLDQFQHTKAGKDEVWQLVTSIAASMRAAGVTMPTNEELRGPFDGYHWPALEAAMAAIQDQAPPTAAPKRTDSDMIAELLTLTRQVAGASGIQEKTLHLVREIYEATTGQAPGDLAALRREVLLRELRTPAAGTLGDVIRRVLSPSPETSAADTPLPLKASQEPGA